ncbi:MAG TPA: hypothetical protein VN645_15580 [Steroidobacteraceae bacterium]|nr:hypothetical protein [Steroidobacteraceae bacterium]
MQRRHIFLVAACALGTQLLCGGVQAAIPDKAPTETDEIVVHARRLVEMRADIVAAEERFLLRYNDLNKIDDFHIECRVEPPTGSRLKQRTCLTRLQLNGQGDHGAQYVQMLQARASGATPSLPSIDPDATFLARYQEYKSNMQQLLKVDPQLRQLAVERMEAEKRYDAELKRRFKASQR